MLYLIIFLCGVMAGACFGTLILEHYEHWSQQDLGGLTHDR
jgi:hypothetical protein